MILETVFHRASTSRKRKVNDNAHKRSAIASWRVSKVGHFMEAMITWLRCKPHGDRIVAWQRYVGTVFPVGGSSVSAISRAATKRVETQAVVCTTAKAFRWLVDRNMQLNFFSVLIYYETSAVTRGSSPRVTPF